MFYKLVSKLISSRNNIEFMTNRILFDSLRSHHYNSSLFTYLPVFTYKIGISDRNPFVPLVGIFNGSVLPVFYAGWG